MGRSLKRKTETERFIEKIKVDPVSGCWLWQAGLRDGYATLRVGDKRKSAHIWAYERFIGKIPEGMLCCHKCDKPECVNPYHIFLGTHKDNIFDAMQKNRMKSGNRTLLTKEEVTGIVKKFKNGQSKTAIARMLKLDHSTVCKIINGKSYRCYTEGTA